MRVAVTASEDVVSVEVEDDGVGFAVENPNSGFGLAGMRERVFLEGGTLTIESGEQGTRLRALLPAHANGSARPGDLRRAS